MRNTAVSMANTARMLRTQHKGAFLFVEGDSDARIYENLIDASACRILPAQSKSNVIGAVQILEKSGFQGVVGIVDIDFSVISGRSWLGPNLFVTDSHDLETMVMQTPALEKVLTEYGSKRKIEQVVKRHGKSLRAILLERALPIGCLRFISERDHLSLRFRELPFGKFVNRSTLELNQPQLIKTVLDHSKVTMPISSKLASDIVALQGDGHDPWHLCCGHDLTQLLALGVQRCIGTCSPSIAKHTMIERSLRLAYERAYFAETRLHQALRDWEAKHPPYRILFSPGHI